MAGDIVCYSEKYIRIENFDLDYRNDFRCEIKMIDNEMTEYCFYQSSKRSTEYIYVTEEDRKKLQEITYNQFIFDSKNKEDYIKSLSYSELEEFEDFDNLVKSDELYKLFKNG